MKPDDTAIKRKIVEAAIQCIEKEGMHSVTIRGIAREAGVNSAAINYYFGSKDLLMEEALKTTLQEGFPNMIAEILEVERKPLQAYFNLLLAQLEGALKFPGISRAHFQDGFLRGQYSESMKEVFGNFLDAILEKLKPVVDKEGKRTLKLSIVQSLSVIYFASLFPDFFKEFSGIDFQVPKARKTYVKHLMKKYFGDRL